MVLKSMNFILSALYLVLCTLFLDLYLILEPVDFPEATKLKVPSTMYQAQSTKHKVQSSKHKVQSTKYKEQSSRFKAPFEII
jgi:hypothetical protein